MLPLVKAESLVMEIKYKDFRFGDSCLSQITAIRLAITHKIS